MNIAASWKLYSYSTMWILQLHKSEAMKSFSQDDISELRSIFALMDRSRRGKTSTEEMKWLLNLQNCYPNETELEEIMTEIDIDCDGEISFEDFVAYCSKRKPSRSSVEEDKEIKDAFDFLDRNGDGYVTSTDVKHVMRLIGQDVTEEQAEQMLAELDEEGNGVISYECFRKMMLKGAF